MSKPALLNRVVTIDGPSGAGKGTLGKSLAYLLKLNYLDSGALYRAAAIVARKVSPDLSNLPLIMSHLGQTRFRSSFDSNAVFRILINDVDVSSELRMEQVSSAAAKLAQSPLIRESINSIYHSFEMYPGLVADGRDMGSAVFPNATVKFYLTANAEVRARRRLQQLNSLGVHDHFDVVLKSIIERDHLDMNRTHSPLVIPPDAIVIDSSSKEISEVLQLMKSVVILRFESLGIHFAEC